ncbi:hypothetical protein RRG08_011143 [Elysia crispata]|uniref:Uncharacterized protein n=1 Tax=Elysia crispata TaxID=231223 RepID=A0AAE1A0Q5_9GAST|nr:hypothetical protein RRG08_011143 [Elysia crispata]
MGTGGDSQTSFLEKGLDAGHQVVPNLVATKVKDTEQGEEKISRKEVARRGGTIYGFDLLLKKFFSLIEEIRKKSYSSQLKSEIEEGKLSAARCTGPRPGGACHYALSKGGDLEDMEQNTQFYLARGPRHACVDIACSG